MSQDFRLVSDFQTIIRRPFELVDPTILKPTADEPLVMGEWLEIDSSSYKLLRGTAEADVPSFCIFAETGRYETQALGRVPALFMGPYEADTKVMDSGSIVVGSPLMVNDVSYGGGTKRGLALATSTHLVVGFCTRTPAENGGFLRFIKTL